MERRDQAGGRETGAASQGINGARTGEGMWDLEGMTRHWRWVNTRRVLTPPEGVWLRIGSGSGRLSAMEPPESILVLRYVNTAGKPARAWSGGGSPGRRTGF